MKRLAHIAVALFLVTGALLRANAGNPKPEPMPAPKPVAPKAKVTPAAPKPGELVVIDASGASGNVRFDHDFAVNTFFVDGKKLVASVPAAQKDTKIYSVRVTYWKEELSEKVDLRVAGTDGPQPDAKQDTLKQLRADMAAALGKLDTTLGVIDTRLKALEQIKPIPPPDPKPDPKPEPGDSLRVMIVTESSVALPSAQQAILTSKTVRDYLSAKTIPTADGLKRGWYITDKDADFSKESKFWQDVLARPRQGVPWIVITTSKTGYDGPLPATIDDTITLLRRFGGN